MRGKHITKPIEMVIAEARELAADGVRELNLVAQDTTYYGLDLYGEVRLVELLRELYSGRVEPVAVIVLKDLYDLLEKVIDRCRDAGNVISHIVLKNS